MKARFPFTSFPNGWFLVAYSDELPIGGVVPLRYFGKDTALFRGSDGLPHMVDAYCPHMGAHMGHGGVVCETTLRCPFHGWRYDGDGRCVEIPSARKIPEKARVQSWPIREQDGLLMAYHSLDGKAPSFEPPALEDYGVVEWSKPRRFEWKVRSHVQDILENSVDQAHFQWVHGSSIQPKCEVIEDKGPIMHLTMNTTLDIEGMRSLPGLMRMRNVGLGRVDVHFDFGITQSRTLVMPTPIDEEHVVLRVAFQLARTGTPLDDQMEAMAVADVEKNVKRDIMIFEHKSYQAAPLLCESDGPIIPLRRWASQFYAGVGNVA